MPKNDNNALLTNVYEHSDTDAHQGMVDKIEEVFIKQEYTDVEIHNENFSFPQTTESEFIFIFKKISYQHMHVISD